MTRTACLGIALFCAVSLSACDDPERTRFVGLCVESGDTDRRCGCMFEVLVSEVAAQGGSEDGTVDAEFIAFVADFAGWTQSDQGLTLQTAELKSKYDLSDDEFRFLAELVGGTMIAAFNSCDGGPRLGPLPVPDAQ